MNGALLAPLFAFVIAAGVLTVTPGVDMAMVLRSSASHGPRAGVGAAIGICAGLMVWGCGAAFGLTALLSASELAFTVLKLIGATYLLFLGSKLILKRRGVQDQGAEDKSEIGGSGAIGALRRGFLTNVLNPKVGVFYITFLPQFIPHDVNVATFSLILAGVHVLLTSAWFALLIALTVPLGRLLRTPPVVRALDRLTGCVFVAFGVKLMATQRS